MGMRQSLEREVLIRLNENGFVETIRYFGLPRRFKSWLTRTSQLDQTPQPGKNNRDLMFARMPVKRTRSRQPGDAPSG
jgi:hypothetical protein